MKKLIITMAVVAIGFMSQAATVSWGMTQVYNYGSTSASPTSDRATGYIAYLMVGDGSGMTALAGEGVDAITAYVTANNTYGGSSKTSAGAVSVSAYGDYASANATVYAVVFNAETIADATHFYVTGAQELVIPSGDADGSVAFGKQKTGTTVASNWNAITSSSEPITPAIPEPTSGLLMLVGLGALALRRRRA